jgi:hypothetical protein
MQSLANVESCMVQEVNYSKDIFQRLRSLYAYAHSAGTTRILMDAIGVCSLAYSLKLMALYGCLGYIAGIASVVWQVSFKYMAALFGIAMSALKPDIFTTGVPWTTIKRVRGHARGHSSTNVYVSFRRFCRGRFELLPRYGRTTAGMNRTCRGHLLFVRGHASVE